MRPFLSFSTISFIAEVEKVDVEDISSLIDFALFPVNIQKYILSAISGHFLPKIFDWPH